MRITRADIERRIEKIEKQWGFTNESGYRQVPNSAHAYANISGQKPEDALKLAYMAYGEREALQSLLRS